MGFTNQDFSYEAARKQGVQPGVGYTIYLNKYSLYVNLLIRWSLVIHRIFIYDKGLISNILTYKSAKRNEA